MCSKHPFESPVDGEGCFQLLCTAAQLEDSWKIEGDASSSHVCPDFKALVMKHVLYEELIDSFFNICEWQY